MILLPPFHFPIYDPARVNPSGIDFQIEQLTVWKPRHVLLLSLEDFQVLGKDCGLAVANTKGQSAIIGLEIAAMPQ